MYCPKCGKECNDNAAFCPSCGNALPTNAQPIQQTEKAPESQTAQASASKSVSTGTKTSILSPKIIGIFGVVIATIAAVVVIFSFKPSPVSEENYNAFSPNSLFSVHATDDQGVFTASFFTYKGKKVLKIEDSSYNFVFSLDRSVCVLSSFFDEYKNDVKIVTYNGVEDIGIILNNTYLSMNGDVFVYFDEDENLHWYNIKEKENKLIEGFNCFENALTILAISPDGSAFAFTSNGMSYICVNGESPIPLGKVLPVAISNNGEYVYYCQKSSSADDYLTLFVFDGEKEVKLTDYYKHDFDAAYPSLIMNNDGTQLTFSENGETYITVNGNERQKILPVSYLIKPVIARYKYEELYRSYLVNSLFAMATPLPSLLNQCYSYSDKDFYFVSDKGEYHVIISAPDDFQISADGSSAIFLINGQLHKMDFASQQIIQLTKNINKDNLKFIAIYDLSAVYFLENNELYYQKGTEKPVKLMDDVSRIKLSPDGMSCYAITIDDELYIAHEDKINFEADNVKLSSCSLSSIFAFGQGATGYLYFSSCFNSLPKYLLSNIGISSIVFVD